jgi:hypothetical protein
MCTPHGKEDKPPDKHEARNSEDKSATDKKSIKQNKHKDQVKHGHLRGEMCSMIKSTLATANLFEPKLFDDDDKVMATLKPYKDIDLTPHYDFIHNEIVLRYVERFFGSMYNLELLSRKIGEYKSKDESFTNNFLDNLDSNRKHKEDLIGKQFLNLFTSNISRSIRNYQQVICRKLRREIVVQKEKTDKNIAEEKRKLIAKMELDAAAARYRNTKHCTSLT